MSASIDHRQAGFTITELISVIVLLGILMVPLSALTIDYFGSIMARTNESQLATESQILLRTFVEDLRVASSVRETNEITDTYEPPSGWSTSNTNLILIVSTPAVNSSRDFIIDPLTEEPYHNEYIYYVVGSTLYRRTLANPSAPGNAAVTTCPSANATQSCPADRKLTTHYGALSFVLYDQDDVVTTSIPLARSLVVNVTMRKPAFGQDIEFNNSMRMTMRNTL